MMDPALKEILDLIRCPETRVPLRPATSAELGKLNDRIRGGGFLNRGGEEVSEELEEALVREGGDIAYPIRQGIPILIVEEGLPVD